MICEACWAEAGRRQAAGDPRSQGEIYAEGVDDDDFVDRAHHGEESES